MNRSFSASRGIMLLVFALLAIGFVARLAPLLNHEDRVLRQFTSEDGYLILTMARNMAMGKGMSVADGEIMTNGTQPLVTFLWVPGFWLFDGDRYAGVFTMHLLSIIIGIIAAYLVYRFIERGLSDSFKSSCLPMVAASLYFASHRVITTQHNGLETGLYGVLVLGYYLVLMEGVSDKRKAYSWSFWTSLGALGGLAAWARIDASLMLIATGAAWTLFGGASGGVKFWRRLGQSLLMGMASVVVISPWLIYNKVYFGSIMPISGTAQSMSAQFASNFWDALPAMMTYFLVVVPIPIAYFQHPAVLAVSAAGIIGALVAVACLTPKMRSDRRLLFLVGTVHLVILFCFYGLYFGAPHFLKRYFFPIYPFALLCMITVCVHYLPKLTGKFLRPALVAAVVLLALLNVRVYRNGTNQGHFQVVEWVQENVEKDAWVAAIQTGTLGFFHDRTINLDGKVNPYALKARRQTDIPAYVAALPVQHIADWHGVASWKAYPEIRENFSLAVHDPQANLAVWSRVGAVPTSEGFSYPVHGVENSP